MPQCSGHGSEQAEGRQKHSTQVNAERGQDIHSDLLHDLLHHVKQVRQVLNVVADQNRVRRLDRQDRFLSAAHYTGSLRGQFYQFSM